MRKQGVDGRNTRRGPLRGQTLVELVLTLPVFLLILLGIIELGRAFLIYSEVSNAVREGARYAMVHPGDIAGIVDASRAKVTMLPAAQIPITVTYDTEPIFGQLVVVTATHDLDLLTPLIGDFVGTLHIEMVSRRTILGSE